MANEDLYKRLAALGISKNDIEERFVRSRGAGGQNVNKLATCVVLVHRPSRLTVRCQKERSQGRNRRLALQGLLEKFLERARRERAAANREKALRRRLKRKRPARVKRALLEFKRRRGLKKKLRGRPGLDA